VRDWPAFVRAHLAVDDLTPARQERLVRELAAQLEDCCRDGLTRGLTAAEADAHARAQIADWPGLAADLRGADRAHVQPAVNRFVDRLESHPPPPGRLPLRGRLMIAHLLRDLRYGLRQLVEAPTFSLAAVLTLALGIGATTAMFSVIDSALLRPLPYPDGDRLAIVEELVPRYGPFSVSPANFLDFRRQSASFEHLGAFTRASATLTTAAGPDHVNGALVSWDFFPTLGTPPAAGRTFSAEEDQPGAAPVVVVSHAMWRDRLGATAAILGRPITLDGTPVTVVGIMPPEFQFPAPGIEFWRPLALDPANVPRGAHYLGVAARLKPGVTLQAANADVRGVAERLALQYPATSANQSARVLSLKERLVAAARPALLALFAAVGVVVLIACANVANLLLVRAAARQKEVAIRAALGASRARLAVQMLVESAVLAAAGGTLGIVVGYLCLAPIRTLGTGIVPRASAVALDGRVLAFAMLATVATGLLFGLAPAWQAARGRAGMVLKESGRSSATSGGRWVRNGLLVVEVALSIVLLTGAVLLLRSFARLTRVDLGFVPSHVTTFQVTLPAGPHEAYADAAQQVAFYDALTSRLAAQPGVRAVGLSQVMPLQGSYVLTFDVRGRPPAASGQQPSANYRAVSAGYFEALGIPVARGRGFAGGDSAHGAPVAIVDEAFVRQFFAGQNPIGQAIRVGGNAYCDIVGVVGSVHQDGIDTPATPTMYVPIAQSPFTGLFAFVRTETDRDAGAVVRRAVHDVDPSLPAFAVAPLASIVDTAVAPQRLSMLLLAAFAGVALFLSAIGLYGVVSYAVRLRTREIGLRMAMGASPSDVSRMILRGGMSIALIGTAIGLVAAAVLSGLLRTMLFEIPPSDPWSYAATSVTLVAVALVACYIPARRAMAVSPLVAMQEESR
jgi:putative ABC transport system permease protein